MVQFPKQNASPRIFPLCTIKLICVAIRYGLFLLNITVGIGGKVKFRHYLFTIIP